jgi:hypothetical protein
MNFARKFAVFSLFQKEILFVQTYFVMTSECARTNIYFPVNNSEQTHELQVMKTDIHNMVGPPGTIPLLHFYLTITDKYPHGTGKT